MGANLYRELTDLLTKAGCEFVRQAKGSHEYWQSPVSGRFFVVPSNLEKRHTANAILKQAGLPKAF